MGAEEVEFYFCPQCGEKYEDIDDAKDCCDIESQTEYKCSECGKFYDIEEDAEECCVK